jgi:hypothetical protein
VLTWDPTGGATLELIGGFSPRPGFRNNPSGGLVSDGVVGDVRPGTIYGVTVAGQPLSLWDAQRGNLTADLVDGKVREEFWHSSWICVGAHIATAQEPALTKATVTIDNLYYLTDDGRFCAPQWTTSIEGVEHPGETQPDGTLLTPYMLPVVGGYRAAYAHADTSEGRYSIATSATRPWISPATEAMPGLKLQMMTTNLRQGPVVKLHVGAHAHIQLPDNAPGSAADFMDRIAAIADLVQLATFEPCGIAQITVDTGTKPNPALLVHTGTVARSEDVHESRAIVFTLADVSLQDFLRTRQRFTSGNQASYAWSVVVGLCGYTPRLVEEHLSQALAAAEGFHRWCLNGGSSVKLNARLRGLHDRLDHEVKEKLGIDPDRWVGWAVWARNHVAHGGANAWRQIRDTLELHTVAESVHLVTYLVALQELAVPRAAVLDALHNHPRLSTLADCCAEVNDLGEPTS